MIEIQQAVQPRLQIVSPAGLSSQLHGSGRESRAPYEGPALAIRHVVPLRIQEALAVLKPGEIDAATGLRGAPQGDVARADAPVQEASPVHVLDGGQQLLGEHQQRLHAELGVADLQLLLHVGPQQLRDQHQVRALPPSPPQPRDSGPALELLLRLDLPLSLGHQPLSFSLSSFVVVFTTTTTTSSSSSSSSFVPALLLFPSTSSQYQLHQHISLGLQMHS